MGILDDAIREHLELKRSHGASDDEIRLKEAEAFGARQEAAAAAAAESDAPHDEHTQLLTPDERPEADDAAPADLEPLQPAPEDPYAVHPGDDLVPDPEVPPAPEARPAPAHHHDEQHPALVDHDHIGGEEHAPEPVFGHRSAAPAAPPETPLEPPPVEDPPVVDPPVEDPDIDEPPPRPSAGEGEGETDDEDVLEETPEFLQDAPEHDRLWFEQKPPRDFDFGE